MVATWRSRCSISRVVRTSASWRSGSLRRAWIRARCGSWRLHRRRKLTGSVFAARRRSLSMAMTGSQRPRRRRGTRAGCTQPSMDSKGHRRSRNSKRYLPRDDEQVLRMVGGCGGGLRCRVLRVSGPGGGRARRGGRDRVGKLGAGWRRALDRSLHIAQASRRGAQLVEVLPAATRFNATFRRARLTCRSANSTGCPTPYVALCGRQQHHIGLGRIRAADLDRAPAGATAEEVMDPGPATVRTDADFENSEEGCDAAECTHFDHDTGR